MKYLILSLLISCTSPRFVVQDAQITIRNNKVTVKPFGPKEPVRDTVMVVRVIHREK